MNSEPEYHGIDATRGRRISAAMHARGMAYNCQLCYDLNVSESTLSRWRAGQPISLGHALALAAALDISVDWLLLGCEQDQTRNRFSRQVTELARYIRSLDPDGRALVVDLVRSLSGRQTPTGEVA